ncbi:PH domain-containing protein [Alteromonas sp. 1_MG-2023]|uniref:PH domain-containing protein n=1 Tax=Alteromonas sp. 1_MG-2023 TaxID=3062669 RepID=UPI0026E3C093|nr:PH domain-containing protein [Alteromonas sp. 1_MG-2023]MDO6567224.1 PH domain-containing protein [Alteromonas sp. 1_MG-2023]
MASPEVDTAKPSESSAGSQTVKVDTGEDWRRLSPIAIAYFTLRSIKNMAQGAIYAVPAIAVTANINDSIQSPITLLSIAALVIIFFSSGVVSFFMYRFRVNNQHVEIHSGVFSRSYTNLPFWRIQNVKIELPFYYRPFGFALVVLDTAGSAGEEAKIVAVPLAYAHALRKQVLAEHQEHGHQENGYQENGHQERETSAHVNDSGHVNNRAHANNSSQACVDGDQSERYSETNEDGETILNRRSITDIVIHGITNNRVWIFLGAAAPFYDNAFGYLSEWLAEKGLQLNQLVGEQTIAWWQFGLYAFVMLMMAMAVVALISIGGALFTFYDYTLSRQHDRYIRRSGLLNKQEVSMRASRIQVISAKQDWLDRILKRVNLYFEQNASIGHSTKELMSPNRLIVPSVTEDEADELSQEVMPQSKIRRSDYQSISKRFILHWVIAALAIPFVVGTGIGIYTEHLDITAGVTLVSAILLGIITLRWWRWGVVSDDKYIYVRRGRIGIDYLCFEPYKVQQVVVKQSVFMKRRKLATVQFVLASGAISVPFLPEEYANKLANNVLFEVESKRKSWM